jgi:hypothetical protein
MRLCDSVLMLAMIGLGMSHAQVSDDSAAESKLMAMEQIEKVQAPRTKDFRALDAILDDAFQGVDSEGNLLEKKDILARLQAADSLELVRNSMAVKIHGYTAIVTGLYRITGGQRGKPFVRTYRFVDTWQRRSGRWVEISSMSTPSAGH